MEDTITKLGTFSLHFPHQLHNQTNPISGTDQREHIFIGEEFDINIIAKSGIDPVENSTELTKWKCVIQALQPVVTIVSSQSLSEEDVSSEKQDSFTACKPLASYKERLKVLCLSDYFWKLYFLLVSCCVPVCLSRQQFKHSSYV